MKAAIQGIRRRTFLTMTGASAAAAILAACGNSATSANTPTSGGAATTGATAPTAVPMMVATALPAVAQTAPTTVPTAAMAMTAAMPMQAPSNGTLRIATPDKLTTLDPTGASSVAGPTLTVSRQIWDSLVVKDPMTGDYRPSLATKWDTPDPQTWVFTLRPDVKFHDGTAVTSADVKATLDRITQQKGPVQPLWGTLDTVETPDPLTARMKFKAPIGTVLGSAALLPVIPAAQINADGFFNKPIGSGPFKVNSFKPDDSLTLDANPTYWGGAPKLQSLVFRIIPETTARLTSLQNGEIDITWSVPPDQLPKLKGDPNLVVTPTPSYTYYFVWFNSKRPPLTDKRVRQALLYAVDVDSIVKNLLAGIGMRAQAPIPATVFGFAPQTPYAYDPNKAKQLLMDAGYMQGPPIDMHWTITGGPQIQSIADTLVSYWNAVGVKVASDQQEPGIWLDKNVKLDWDMQLQTNQVTTGDADFTLRRLYVSSANRNGYGNPDLDKALSDAAGIPDQKQRAMLYAQAEKIIWDDAVGLFPFDLTENFVYSKKVSGFVPVPNSIPSFASVSVAK